MNREKNILVTGGEGQLATALQRQEHQSGTIRFASKNELDITDAEACFQYIRANNIHVLINTAAYTKVDAAETEQELAYSINATAVKNLAEACKASNCLLIHLSTDYVFDGEASVPYAETDFPNPKTIYGKSKLLGEQYILESGIKDFAVIRTSWLYSATGANFYTTMLRLAKTKQQIEVVHDQQGSPTYAGHLAAALFVVAKQFQPENSGIYHYSNTGQTSWYQFAKAILREKAPQVEVKPVPSSAFPTLAVRPKFSVLQSDKIAATFGLEVPSWEAGLRACNAEALHN